MHDNITALSRKWHRQDWQVQILALTFRPKSLKPSKLFRLRSEAAVNVKRFRGGLVFKAHILLYHSTLGLSVTKKKKKAGPFRGLRHCQVRRTRPAGRSPPSLCESSTITECESSENQNQSTCDDLTVKSPSNKAGF